MNEKLWEILNSLWILPSIVVFINGIGLIYAGLRVHKRQWYIEGIIYEIPYLIFQYVFDDVYTNDSLNLTIRALCFLAISLSLIRSIMIRKTYLKMLKSQKHQKQEKSNAENQTHINNLTQDKHESKKVNINEATLEELLTIPGFNTIIAKQLIQYRKSGNYILSEDDLANKLNLPKHQVERISAFITIEKVKSNTITSKPPKLDL